MVAPVGERYSQILLKGRNVNGRLVEEFSTPCAFVPLIGEHGWKSDDDFPQISIMALPQAGPSGIMGHR